jgi:YVTN family beta-propeller protein
VRIFISYRRDDSPDVAGRIRDRLAEEFGKDNVYYDVDSIPFGVDFRQYINSMVHHCDAVLVVIGPGWLDATDEGGRHRLEGASDFVRLEVEAALDQDIRVVPVLVHGAEVPTADTLPPSIASLSYRNGLPVRRDPDFHADMTRLIKSLTRDSTHSRLPGGALLERIWRPAAVGSAALVALALVIWLLTRDNGSANSSDSTGAVTSTVASSAATTIGPTSTFAVRQTLPTVRDPGDLEVVGDQLWVSSGSGTLERVDLKTGHRSEPISFGVNGGNDLLVDDGELAVTLFSGSSVGFVDLPADQQETVQVKEGKPLNGAVTTDGLWFSCQKGQAGYLVHMKDRKESGSPIPVELKPFGVVADDGQLFVTFTESDRVGRIDISTGGVKVAPTAKTPVDVALINGDLWITLGGSDQVAVLDPSSLEVKATYAVGHRPWKLAFGLGSVWVTNKGEPGQQGSVSRLDPSTGTRQQPDVTVGKNPDELAIGAGRVYVANRQDNTVSVLAAA